MGRGKPLCSLNAFLSYVPPLSRANSVSLFTLLLAFLETLHQLLWSQGGVKGSGVMGVASSLDDSFGGCHSYLEAIN